MNPQVIPLGSALTHQSMPFFAKIRMHTDAIRIVDRPLLVMVMCALLGSSFAATFVFTYRIGLMDLYLFMFLGISTIVPTILGLWSMRVKREVIWCEKSGIGTFLDQPWRGRARFAECAADDIIIRLQEIEPKGPLGPRFHAAIMCCNDFVLLLCASQNERKVAQYLDQLPPVLANATRISDRPPGEL